MRLLFGFVPFHPPVAPPFGLACLEAAVRARRPQTEILLRDWNLDFFRRWLLARPIGPPHLCAHHPGQMLAQICPNLLVADGRGQAIWQALTELPTDEAGTDRVITAAVQFDELYAALFAFYTGLLSGFVERRATLSNACVDELFATELADVERLEPDLFGLSVLAENNLCYALALGRVVKERHGIPVAIGGAMTSHLDPAELLAAFPWVDHVFVGEAEGTLLAFIDRRVGSVENLPGLATRDARGRPQPAEPPTPPDIRALPMPDFSDFDLPSYLVAEPVLPISTSRGCYWGKCTFCSHLRTFADGVRVRRAAEVVGEMVALRERHGTRHFLFVDEAISPAMVRGLADEILQRGLDVRWGAEGIRAERQLDRSLLLHAHLSGMRWIYVGVEAYSQRLLDRIDKGIEQATVVELIAACEEVGITPHLSFILGIPGTTAEELDVELGFLLEHPADSSPFVLQLGSPMHRRAKELGIRVEDQQIIFVSPGGVLHAPRFHFTVPDGISVAGAEQIAAVRLRDRPRRRPHLGEVHAVLLADTEFFRAASRPERPPVAADVALRALAGRSRDADWSLHRAAHLEAIGDFEAAAQTVRAALDGDVDEPYRRRLLVHRAALLNGAGHPDEVIAAMAETDLETADHDSNSSVGAALRAELLEALHRLGRSAEVLEHGRALLRSGLDADWLHPILAEHYERLGQMPAALAAWRTAETHHWHASSINRAQARCLAAIGREKDARRMTEKAQRKERDARAVTED